MVDKFDQCFEWLRGNEGGYSNNPNDAGGETMWGVTVAVARECGYHGNMNEMTVETAKEIYKARYWRDWMDCAPMPLAFELFDTAVNSGPGVAARLLQRTLGVAEDGTVGPRTRAAATARSPSALWVAFVGVRLEYLTRCKGWPHFSAGWTNRVAGNLKRGAAALEG